MSAQRILDSHVHLWPASAANNDAHARMHQGDQLAKQYSIADYLSASSPTWSNTSSEYELKGFVYVETDRRIRRELEENEDILDFKWAEQCLAEHEFLTRIMNGAPLEGVDEGFDRETAKFMKGCILWAPIDKGLDVFQKWVDLGNSQDLSKVKGFRFLLQGIRDQEEFEKLVNDPEVVEVLRYMGSVGWSFDIGIDQRRGGSWQLDLAAGLIERVHEGIEEDMQTVFVLNHLCKPDMEHPADTLEASFKSWKASMTRLASCRNTYMKLSGAFSEITNQDPYRPWSIPKLAYRMQPWLDHLFSTFTPQRIMFGSDWPVCNVRGPGDVKSWEHWRLLIDTVLDEMDLTDEEKNRIWFGTAEEVYMLDKDDD